MTTGVQPLQGRVRSEMLGELRKIDGLKSFFGSLAQFVVVVDANVILGDLIWLVSKRKNPMATTELVECIMAGTVVAYIARPVLAEVDEHIALIAIDKNLSENALRQEWKKYRKLIKVRTPRKALVDRYKDGQDPDDAPTIALEKMIRADGILSKDRDIVAMGGLVIEADFTRLARNYSRKTAVAVSIKACGITAMTFGLGAIGVLVQLVKDASAQVMRFPPAVKLIIVVVILIIIADTRSRERVIDILKNSAQTLPEFLLPMLLRFIAEATQEVQINTLEPPILRFKPNTSQV